MIDVIKCIAAFMVVMLHKPCLTFGDPYMYIQTAIGRCGVPLFLMISGYLLSERLEKCTEPREHRRMFGRQALRMIKYYVIFGLIVIAADAVLDGAVRGGIRSFQNCRI